MSKPHIRLHVSRVMHSGGTRHVDFWRVQVFRRQGGPLMHIGRMYSTARAAAAEAALAATMSPYGVPRWPPSVIVAGAPPPL